ncbi:MAG: bifunctional precorrin-2 dehydrogenase/sirohydrochlorin ferrochelatase [bacterium]|nr:bifunctional precorrin-2 dehydrogenase/sirohydrochlorin ferrochelatase [bacterium]
MRLFPFFQDIEGKTFLVIGGGAVAAEKVKRLQVFTDRIVVIAERSEIRGIKVLRRPFEEADLALADYCVCATDDAELNARVAGLCVERGIPVNVADNPALCGFVFPALVKRGDLVIGITTAGKSPAYAALLREQIEAMLPERVETVLERLDGMRRYVQRRVPAQAKRRRICHLLLDALLETRGEAPEETLLKIVEDNE